MKITTNQFFIFLFVGLHFVATLRFVQMSTAKSGNLELQGHGRTANKDRPVTYAAVADDVASLLKHIKLVLQHPQVVNNLIIISSVFKLDGWIYSARDILWHDTREFNDAD